MNFGPVLILIQINENKKRKCPSLGEGGGGLLMSACKKGWESRVSEQMHILFPFLFVTGTLTVDISFFFNDN